jgi:septal ring factor EnvC (AmiA/AmiB activator)
MKALTATTDMSKLSESEKHAEILGKRKLAAEIACAGEEHLSEQDKKKRLRMCRNRLSAQASRDRKKTQIGELSNKLRQVEERNTQLEQKLSVTMSENQRLKDLLERFCRGVAPTMTAKIEAGNILEQPTLPPRNTEAEAAADD